ncbi:MAG: fatty acid desaturase family protein [Acidimicrobiales bacterium]
MTPRPALLPDVLPTDRLTKSGRPVPEVRASLRKIPSVKNVGTVAGAYLQSFGVIAIALWIDRWWAYVVAFLLMGRAFALYNILAHEAAHRLLFRSRAINDFVGRWLLAYPAFNPFEIYRRLHMSHHRDELGPNEPDAALYAGYPITRASLCRKLLRDALFVSGWKNIKPLLLALTKATSRTTASRIVLVQLGIWILFAAVGYWWVYPLLWLAPSMTVWRVLNRLRAIAEHGGMTRSDDRRLTTHVVRQRRLARFWVVPYNAGWHLAHHVDMGIPWRNLPKLHEELVASGWVTDELEYPRYLALWSALASRGEH